MERRYPTRFGVCHPCQKIYVSPKLGDNCPKCSTPLKHVTVLKDDKEFLQNKKKAKQSINIWKAFNPPPVEEPEDIFHFNFDIRVNQHFRYTKLLRFKKRIEDKILVEYSRFSAQRYFGRDCLDELYIKRDMGFEPLGELQDLLIYSKYYNLIDNLLFGRIELFGYIHETGDFNHQEGRFKTSEEPKITLPCTLKVYISPNYSDYYLLANELHKKDEETRIRIHREMNEIRRKEEEERNRKYLEERNRKFREKRNQAYEIHKKQHSGLFSFFTNPPKLRTTHCYRCQEYLFSSTHRECSKCKWLICDCGACGCGFIKS